MAQSVCPHCGHPIGDPGDVDSLQAWSGTGDESQSEMQAHLIQYTRDLVRLYNVQKRLEQYLPGAVRECVSQGGQPAKAERRQVTVLCADLSEFSRLTARLELEYVFDLLNACFRRLFPLITQHGGVVDKFVGDGIVAVFGAPVAHEDDPARAVQAALDMDWEMRVFTSKARLQLGGALLLHTGINCGTAIVGNVGVDEQLSYTVVGHTVTLAFRLQEIAEPGTILVSTAVQQATQHLFKYRYRDDVRFEGFAKPVPVFSVER
jgi:adenylate cyclase